MAQGQKIYGRRQRVSRKHGRTSSGGMDGFGRGPKISKKQGQPLEQDYHRVAAAVLTGKGTSAYNMSKTLASNNVLPPSSVENKCKNNGTPFDRKNGQQLRRAQAKEGWGGDSWARSPDAVQFRGEIATLERTGQDMQ
jgi:hypothetical protein